MVGQALAMVGRRAVVAGGQRGRKNPENSKNAEASPDDEIWGTGLMEGLTQVPRHWKGTNILGWALMEVRNHVRVAGRSHVRAALPAPTVLNDAPDVESTSGVGTECVILVVSAEAPMMPAAPHQVHDVRPGDMTSVHCSLSHWDGAEYGDEYLSLEERGNFSK